jgi:hypothetical protein
VLCLETTTSFYSCWWCCQRAEFWLSSSIRWTGQRLWEPRAWGYACFQSRNGTVWEVGAELLALWLSSLIRWTRRCPGGTSSRSLSGTGLLELWLVGGKSRASAGSLCARLGWMGRLWQTDSLLWWGEFTRVLCCAMPGEFPRTLEMYRLRWIVLLYFELCKFKVKCTIELCWNLFSPETLILNRGSTLICPSPI